MKSIPRDKDLYESLKSKVKKSVKRWPSAYASGQLVQAYKLAYAKKYGKNGKPYLTSKTQRPLARWFKEQWVDLCKPKGKTYKPCSSQGKNYPYCRPLMRINKHTPMTVNELLKKYGATKINEMCSKKQKAKKKVIRL